MSDSQNDIRAYTLRLELVDEPGELLRSLHPIADNGGNLLSIFHERGNVTPRGHIPVEVDIEATPDRFEKIVDALHEADINVVQAGTERYSEALTIVLSGHVIETDLSDTLERIQASANATVTDVSLSAPEGTADTSSARLQIAAESGATGSVLEGVREVAAEKDLRLIEPLTTEGDR
ncbi:amino acid-binding protein [Halopenitus persicus]|uniref:ACT domain-containing protein n=1 Tax=Halopenitus persicus TaxID=1048396 RepID=A0A1H3EU29_9EURY|nr:amino acid-binding protein [Halopenitus persicus]QHS17704.1 amino acid-binding protein [haloarchaeon 3A1-DGR]SDX82273.1 ACT domain-containing protein [Halopenitus persicus]